MPQEESTVSSGAERARVAVDRGLGYLWAAYGLLVVGAVTFGLTTSADGHLWFDRLGWSVKAPLLGALLVVSWQLLYWVRSRGAVRRIVGSKGIHFDGETIVGLLVIALFTVAASLLPFAAFSAVAVETGLVRPQPAQVGEQASKPVSADTDAVGAPSAEELMRKAAPGRLMVWEMLNAIPLGDIPDTVGWERPMQLNRYERGWLLGLAALTLKIVFGVLVINAGRHTWQLRHGDALFPAPPVRMALPPLRLLAVAIRAAYRAIRLRKSGNVQA